MKTKAQQ